MKDAMKQYFDRLLRKWSESGLGSPRASWDPDVDPTFWLGPPDSDEYATWRPIEKTVIHDLGALAPELGPLHPCFSSYFNAWWFAALEGQFGGLGLSLEPVLPGKELDSFLGKARGYASRFAGPPPCLPIGVEFNGLQVVVDRQSGTVGIDDWERGTVAFLAPSLEHLIEHLQP